MSVTAVGGEWGVKPQSACSLSRDQAGGLTPAARVTLHRRSSTGLRRQGLLPSLCIAVSAYLSRSLSLCIPLSLSLSLLHALSPAPFPLRFLHVLPKQNCFPLGLQSLWPDRKRFCTAKGHDGSCSSTWFHSVQSEMEDAGHSIQQVWMAANWKNRLQSRGLFTSFRGIC